MVNSQTADDHLEWCGLVESKIRLLIGNLERNQHISLAHVNPKCFDHKKGNSNSNSTSNNNNNCSQNSSSTEENKTQNSATAAVPAATGTAASGQATLTASPFCSMWFIGLEFERTENLNVDLTESIQNFTEHVIQHGVSFTYQNKENFFLICNCFSFKYFCFVLFFRLILKC